MYDLYVLRYLFIKHTSKNVTIWIGNNIRSNRWAPYNAMKNLQIMLIKGFGFDKSANNWINLWNLP